MGHFEQYVDLIHGLRREAGFETATASLKLEEYAPTCAIVLYLDLQRVRGVRDG